MKKLLHPALLLAYTALVFTVPPAFGPSYSPWHLGMLSVLFVGAYALTGGAMATSITAVIVLTLLFPLAFLAFIGLPVYQSWSAMASDFVSANIEYGQFWGLEILFPLALALVTATSIKYWRANKTFMPPG